LCSKVDQNEVFLEGGSDMTDLSVRPCREARPIEDEFIVPTDQIAVEYRNAGTAREAPKHLLPQSLLAQMKGTRGEIDQNIDALIDQALDRVKLIETLRPKLSVIPNVFADRHPKAQPPKQEGANRLGRSRLKVAGLVKHIVGRQEALMKVGDDLSAFEEGRGIEEVFSRGPGVIGIERADQHGSSVERHFGEFRHLSAARTHKGLSLQKIPRRISTNGKLGRDHKLCALAAGLAIRILDSEAIAAYRTDRTIELSESNLHRERVSGGSRSRSIIRGIH
jgi:hypothetical protein